jgi:hypothetical protein
MREGDDGADGLAEDVVLLDIGNEAGKEGVVDGFLDVDPRATEADLSR